MRKNTAREKKANAVPIIKAACMRGRLILALWWRCLSKIEWHDKISVEELVDFRQVGVCDRVFGRLGWNIGYAAANRLEVCCLLENRQPSRIISKLQR